MTGSAGQKRVPADFVSQFRIPLPSLSAQHRIAAILDKADGTRRKREEGIRLTEDLLRSTFLDMFGDPINFPAVPLAEIAEVVSGVTKGRKLTGQVVTVPYLRVANVQDGFLDLDEIKTIEALPDEVHALALQLGDIVMTEGGDHDKLGRGAIWTEAISKCIHQNHVFRVRVNQKHILPIYFAEFLKTLQAKMYFLRCAKKTTNLASINMTQLRGLPVPVPPLSQRLKFEKAIISTKNMSTSEKMQQVQPRIFRLSCPTCISRAAMIDQELIDNTVAAIDQIIASNERIRRFWTRGAGVGHREKQRPA